MGYMQLLLVIILLVLCYMAFTAPNLQRRDFKAPRLLAHRGLHNIDRGIPENSLAAFETACQLGYGMELDVQLTADDQLVVFHDDSLMRMCGVEGDVQQMTLSQLHGLPLLGTDQTIPTLREVLELVNGRAPILVELKDCPRIERLTELAMAELAAYRGDYLVESFNPMALQPLKRSYPAVVRGQLVGRFNAVEPEALGRFVLSKLLLNFVSRPDFIAFDQRMNHSFTIWAQRTIFKVPLAVWTVKSQADFARLAPGVQMIIFEGFLPEEPIPSTPLPEEPKAPNDSTTTQ